MIVETFIVVSATTTFPCDIFYAEVIVGLDTFEMIHYSTEVRSGLFNNTLERHKRQLDRNICFFQIFFLVQEAMET